MASSLRLFDDWKNDELKGAYNRIWALSGTTNDGARREGILKGSLIQYGTTPTNKIGSTIVNFAREKKKINLSYNTRKSPTFISLQTDIKNKRAVAYSYWVKNKKGQVNGHTVFVQGTMTGKKGNATHNFIVLADGWGYDARYMNYSTIPQTLNGSEATAIYGKAV
ncbi:hypothetical protein [Enterococcus caccae]|nr:hypothetical protein [Enterococcus caccae]